MTKHTVNFPRVAEEMRAALKAGIEFYQGSPVKNLNKLNESLAAALGVRSYDALSALLKPAPVARFSIKLEDNGDVFMSNESIHYEHIHDTVFDNEMVAYKVCNKLDLLDDLWQYRGMGSLIRDHQVIQADIELLRSNIFRNDDCILSSISTNHYISRHVEPELFDQICNEMLKHSRALYDREDNQ